MKSNVTTMKHWQAVWDEAGGPPGGNGMMGVTYTSGNGQMSG